MSESKYRPHKHDMWRTPTWYSWRGMIQRCTNPRATAYHQYGGRGITVCPEWSEFSRFFADMGARPAGTSLDRIDGNGNYQKNNCRWATRTEQQRNRRDCNKYMFRGERLTLQEWSERTGISVDALRRRYRAGWPAEVALTMPSSKTNSVLRKARIQQRNQLGRFQ